MKIESSKVILPAPIVLLTLFLLVLFYIFCNPIKAKESLRDSSINSKTSFNNLFLDSSYLENFILQQDSLKKYYSDIFDFYSQRNFEFAWFDEDGLTEQAHNFYNLQNDLIANLADSTLYNPELQQLYDKLLECRNTNQIENDSLIKKAELSLTGQFFRYSNKVYQGSELNIAQLGWYIPRKKINITKLLDSLVDGKEYPIKMQEPLNSQYRLLENELSKYQQLNKILKWDSIPDDKTFKMGEKGRVIPIIKNRLFLLGDSKVKDTSTLFNNSMLIAVKKFQYRFGIPATGKIGNSTFKQLNLSPKTLIIKILINMERARWMPLDTSRVDRIVINIPEFKLNVYDSGIYSFSMPVIVGSEAHNTVIFSESIRYIVFSPYWNVPTSITRKEEMPAIERNRNYLQQHNMEIVKYDGNIPEIRQKPGLNNALGKVKFLFPNKFNIYLHDTPNKDAFLNSKRGFSHGCIRIGNPSALAKFLLRRQPLYTTDSISTLMNQSKEKWVDSKPFVQVIIKYFTAWVDAEGIINFREDIYGHDKKMQEKLFD